MGEIADDINNGIMCQICGGWMPEVDKAGTDTEKLNAFFDNPPGYSRTCPDCESEDDLRNEEY